MLLTLAIVQIVMNKFYMERRIKKMIVKQIKIKEIKNI